VTELVAITGRMVGTVIEYPSATISGEIMAFHQCCLLNFIPPERRVRELELLMPSVVVDVSFPPTTLPGKPAPRLISASTEEENERL